jgi:eukaryotic-like serine/threonine-protein kinase
MELTPFHGPPASAPQIPGFIARTLLGFGAHGEVWLADDLAGGPPVAIKIGRRAGGLGRDVALRAAPVERETALLSRIQHPHIVRLHRVVHLPDDGLALVLDLAAGGSLAAVIASRGPFEPGEVSTLLIPLADALIHLHGRGVVHGDIAPGNVLFDGDGRPQLGDLGVARVLGTRADDVWSTPGFTDPATRGGASPSDAEAADLWGLAAVGWFALTGRPPGASPSPDGARAPLLSELLIRCLAPDPADRPRLDELADGVWQAARPVPVRLGGEPVAISSAVGLPPLSRRTTHRLDPPGPPAVPTGPARVPGRRWAGRSRAGHSRAVLLVRAGTALGLILVAGLGLAVAGRRGPVSAAPAVAGSGGPSAATAPTAVERELGRELEVIGQARARAFQRLSPADLRIADERGSPAESADLALIERLRSGGYRLEGVRYQVSGVHVVRRHGDAIDVRAVVTTSSHRRVGGRVSVAVPSDGPRVVVLTVVPVGAGSPGTSGWRVRSVGAPA